MRTVLRVPRIINWTIFVLAICALILLDLQARCGGVHAQNSPVDVAPIEKKVIIDNYGISIAPPSPQQSEVIEHSCADKSRFLLQSEDGKYHCLRLTNP